MANNLLFVPCEIWASTQYPSGTDPLDLSLLQKVSNYQLFFPYASLDFISNLSIKLPLSTNGVLNDNYFQLLENIPDLNLLNTYSMYLSANTVSEIPTLINDVFPHAYPIRENTSSSAMCYYLKCKESGNYYWSNQTGGSSGGGYVYIWNESGQQIYRVTSGQDSTFIGYDGTDRVCGVVYHELDSNGKISSASTLLIRQTNANPYPNQLLLFYRYANSPNLIRTLNTFLGDSLPRPLDSDPYGPGGTSETGGGTGTFDLSSDSIDFPSLPTLTAVSTGLVSIYTPTLTQLNSLANFLWNANPTDVDYWKKLVANPLDLILGLSIVPVSVPAGASQNIKVGLIDTGVAMTKAATQFVTVDCGSINVAEVWGSALDYSPFTKFSIYLPFIGTRTINTDDIMGKTVHVKYNIDLLSGACTAMIKCGDSVLYQYSGACAISLPLSGETFTSMITSTIQLAARIAATVSSGGAAAGITAASAANSVMSMKPQIERAGGVSGAAGQLGIMAPYLIAEVPRQSVPARYNTFAGYPSNINAVLGDLTGYTEIETIYIKGISATKSELDEIETLLKAGVII